MRKRNRKMLSLLLAVAMVFSMNTFAFAEEVVVEEVPAGVSEVLDNETVADEGGAVVVDEEVLDLASEEGLAGDVAAEDDGVIAVDDAASETDGAVEIVADDVVEGADAVLEDAELDTISANGEITACSGDQILSDNAAKISANLAGVTCTKLDNYYFVYKTAIASKGQKKATKNATKDIDLKIFKAKSGVTVKITDLVSENELTKTYSASFDQISTTKIAVHQVTYATVDLKGASIVTKDSKKCYVKSVKCSNKEDTKAIKSLLKANKYKLEVKVYPIYVSNDEDAREVATKVAKLNVGSFELTNTSKAIEKWKAKGSFEGKKVTVKYDKKGKKPQKGYFTKGSDSKVTSNKGKNYLIFGGDFAGNYFYN